jgi:hypothetical protein
VKPTDTQLAILSAGAKRDGGAILPFPKSVKLNKGSATLVLKSLLKHKLVTKQPAAPSDEAWREGKDGHRFTLSISAAGLRAIGMETDAPFAANAVANSTRRALKAGDRRKDARAASPRKGTKLSQLVELLQRKTGATIEEAAKATGWQHHSVRGAISGALKKKLALVVTSSTVEGRGRVYRVATQR